MRQGPSFETGAPVEADFEIVPDVRELSAAEVGEEIQKLLAGKQKIKSVENFALKGVHNQMDLEADIDADFVGSFGLKASIKSDGTSIRIGDIDVVAGALKKMAIKKFINSELPTLIPKITDYLSTKYGKSVTGLSIEDGKLKVRFPDEKKKVEKNVVVEEPTPEVAEIVPPVVEVPLPQPVPDEIEASEAPSEMVSEAVEPEADVPAAVEAEPSQPVPPVEGVAVAEASQGNPHQLFESFFNKRGEDLDEVETWVRERREEIEKGSKIKGPKKTSALNNLDKLQGSLSYLRKLGKDKSVTRIERMKAVRVLSRLLEAGAISFPVITGEAAAVEAVETDEVPVASAPDMENGVTTPLPTETVEAPEDVIAQTPEAVVVPEPTVDAVDEVSRQKAEQTVEAIPEKQRRQFYRGFLGLGYTVRGLKSEALSWVAGKLEQKANAAAVDETKAFTGVYEDTEESREERRSKVIFQQDSFLARLVRGSATKYRHDADEALRNLDKIYAEGEKSQAVKGVMSSVQFAALVGQVAFRGASKTFNPFRTAGASLLALGAGVEIAKEARINSLERIEKGRLTYDEALVEAEQISEELRKERGSEKFTSNEYQQEYMKRLPKELLERLKASDVSRLGWASQKAYADIKKTLEKIEARIESAPKGKKARLQKFLGKGFQERYLHDVERLLERDGTIDVVAYGLKKVEKYTKAGAALATVEALAGAFFDYDTVTRDFGNAVEAADPAHPETLLGLDENRTPAPIKYEWSGMTTDSMHAPEPNPLIPKDFLSGHGNAHGSGALVPKEEVVFDEAPETAALLKIGKRGPEGLIIDYFKDHQDIAKKFGWDGNGDIKKWAGTKAHALWLDHASKALENDEVKKSLTELGYTNDLEGYTKMMTRIKSGGVALDLEHKGVTLSNMEYLNNAQPAAPVAELIHKGDFETDGATDFDTASRVHEGEPAQEGVDDSQLWKKRGIVLHDSPVGEESVSAEDVGDKQLWKTKEPVLHAEPVDESLVLDTRGMSVPDAVVARMNHDLTEALGPEDEGRVVWDKFKDYGARRFQNLSLDPEENAGAVRLQGYLKDLEARSGVRPRAHILWFNQSVDQYIRLALKTIEQKSRS